MPLVLSGALDALFSRQKFRVPVAVVLGLALLVSADMNGLLTGPFRDQRLGYVLLKGHPYHTDSNERVARDIYEVVKQLPARTRVAVVWAGIPAYFSDFEMVDTMGYNDREIARGPWAFEISLPNARDYYPGHMKYDLERTLRERKPDLLFQWWAPWDDHERERMGDRGYYRVETGSMWSGAGGIMYLRESSQLRLKWPET